MSYGYGGPSDEIWLTLKEADIRRWRKERLAAGPWRDRPFGSVTVAKAYRLLHTVPNTAVDDRLIRRNPCRIKGAGQEDSPERAVIPLTTLIELLDRVPPRYRALVLLAIFASLRFGELAGLRRVRSIWIAARFASSSQRRKPTTAG